VIDEWNDINAGNFGGAWGLFVPGTVGAESTFVSSHQQTAPITASATVGSPISTSATSATVPLVSLRTTDSSGCKNWTGSYQVQNESGQWLIGKANLQSSSC
jgi:hypothetical protein